MEDTSAGDDPEEDSGTLFMPGVMLGSFRIVALLGRGGMATVYEAYDTRLERAVALKVLPPHFLHDRNLARRFEQEARVIARLEHPGIVPIYASGTDDDIPWMSMRLLHGGNMGTLLKESPLSLAKSINILRHVAAALDYAHAHGVVHRDIKPTNILFDRDERPCVGDFGLAQMLEGSPVVTHAGIVIGTPHYMAPEQANGAGVDHRCDVYSLGIVAYEMLIGRPPFTGGSPLAVLMKHVTEPLPAPAPGQIPEPLLKAIQRATAKDPSQRWASTGDFARALESGLGVTTISASALPLHDHTRQQAARWLGSVRHPGAAMATVAVLVIAAVGWFGPTLWRGNPAEIPPTNIERPPDVPTTFEQPVASSAPEPIPQVDPRPTNGSKTTAPPADSNPSPQETGPATGDTEVAPSRGTGTNSPLIPIPANPKSELPTEGPADVNPQPGAALAPPAPPPPSVVNIAPRAIRTVAPAYPDIARAAEIQGDVVLEITVGANGAISDVVVVRSVHRLLDAEATKAVRRYEYEPGLRNGVPVPVRIRVTVSFKLD